MATRGGRFARPLLTFPIAPLRRAGFMRASFGEPSAMRDDIVLLAGRLLLAWIFLHEGAFLLANYSASSAGMAKMGVPAFVPPLVIALQLAAGAFFEFPTPLYAGQVDGIWASANGTARLTSW